MRILYINHYAGALVHGMEYRCFYLAREWIRMGHEVTIVAASYSHVRSSQPTVTEDIVEQTIEGVRHIWIKTPPYPGNGAKRVFNMLAFVRGLYRFRSRFQQWSPDVVIASSTYPWDIYPARLIARASAAKLVFEVHDLWPLSPMAIGGMSRWHPFIMATQHAEDYACRHSDLIVSILPHADKHLETRGMAPHKYHVVPNGIDLSEWDTEQSVVSDSPALQTVKSLQAQGKFVVGYAGSHGPGNAIDTLLDAVTKIDDPRAAFVLVGSGPSKAAFKQQAAGLSQVHFCDPVLKKEIPALLRSFDCGFYGLVPSPLYAFGYGPNKIFDYMAAGLPIVQSVEAGNDLVRDADCGRTVKSGDSAALAKAIVSLMQLPPSERERMGENAKAFIRARHDYRTLARRFADIVSGAATPAAGRASAQSA